MQCDVDLINAGELQRDGICDLLTVFQSLDLSEMPPICLLRRLLRLPWMLVRDDQMNSPFLVRWRDGSGHKARDMYALKAGVMKEKGGTWVLE